VFVTYFLNTIFYYYFFITDYYILFFYLLFFLHTLALCNYYFSLSLLSWLITGTFFWSHALSLYRFTRSATFNHSPVGTNKNIPTWASHERGGVKFIHNQVSFFLVAKALVE